MAKEHFANPGARIAQKKLAEEVTRLIHKEEGLKEALDTTAAFFSGNVASLKEETIVDVLGGLKKTVTPGTDLLSFLVEVGAASSKREAKTLVGQNSIAVNGQKISDPEAIIRAEDALYGKYFIVKRGKKNYYLGQI